MLIRDTTWNVIRTQFTEEEKAQLREGVTGETLCPRGFVISHSLISDTALVAKLEKAVREAEGKSGAEAQQNG
jgi:hypothetical protein